MGLVAYQSGHQKYKIQIILTMTHFQYINDSGPKESREPEESPTKKTFLRKGSGLVRFGGVGAPPKRMRRSRSQVMSRSKYV